MRLTLYRLIIPVLSVISCARSIPAQDTDSGHEDIYSEQHIRQTGAQDYDKAMALVDKGFRTGHISIYDAWRLRAKLTYQFTNDYHLAVDYCRKALDTDKARTDARARTDILYQLSTASHATKDLTTCLEACTEGKEAAHSGGDIFLMHAFDFMAGLCLFDLDREEDGVSIMQQAIEDAEGAATSKSDYGHLLYYVGSLINCYVSIEDDSAAIDLSYTFERLLGRMSGFEDVPQGYLSRCRFYLELNKALSYLRLGDGDEASAAYGRIMDNPYSTTSDGQLRLAEYYAAIGDVQTVLRILEQDTPYTDPDTVSRAWRLRLRWMESAYRHAGMTEEADACLQRIDALTELIQAREYGENTAVKAARYDTQAYRLTLSDTLDTLRRSRRTEVLILLCMTAMCMLFVLALLRRRRLTRSSMEKTERVEAELARLHKEISLLARDPVIAPSGGQKDSAAPISLAQFIEGQKLYLHKDLSRAMAVELMGISQQTMTRLLGDIQQGLSFPDYIKSLRIKEALFLIQADPNLSVKEIADRSGFWSIRTFERAFLSVTGRTPRQYIQTVKSGE